MTLAEVLAFAAKYAPVLESIYAAEQSGQETDAIIAAVTSALVAASDAEMHKELG